MDPYIDAERLDRKSPFFSVKMANLALGNAEHQTRSEVLGALPVKLTLQTNDTCNLDCPHCAIPRSDKKPVLPERLLELVVEQLFPTLVELHPSNVGEPLAWPLFGKLCEAMRLHGVLLDLTTNGTLLSEARLEQIRPIARDVKVSFDGATPDTFERLRRGASFGAVCEGVRRLTGGLQGAPARPTVALQMTLMRSNFRELPALVRLAASLGASRVKAYHLFSFREAMDHEAMAGEGTLWPPVLEEALREADLAGIELQCAEPALAPGAPVTLRSIACHLPWHETWIDIDGAVVPCHSHGGDTAGNIGAQPFVDLWNGPLYRLIRRGFAEKMPGWHCVDCGMNLQKTEEHEPVPYDPHHFLSVTGRARRDLVPLSAVRWSGRMRQFDLTGRRHGR